MRISDWSSDVCSSDLEMIERFVKHLDEEFEAGKAYLPNKADWFEGRWTGLGKPADPETARRAADTGVPEDRLKQVARTLTTVPDGFNIHKTDRKSTRLNSSH